MIEAECFVNNHQHVVHWLAYLSFVLILSGKEMEAKQGPCRICFVSLRGNISLSDSFNGSSLIEMLRCCVKLEVHENDGLPYECCTSCKDDLLVAYSLVVRFLESDAKFRKLLEDASSVERLSEKEPQTDCSVKSEYKLVEELVYVEPFVDTSNDAAETTAIKDESADSSEDEDEFDALSDGEDHEEQAEEVRVTRSNYISTPKRCCRCKTRLHSIEQVQKHSKIHEESRITDPRRIKLRPYECSNCFKRYTKQRALELHQREMYADKPFQCDECEEDFHSASHLEEHKDSHGKEKVPKKGPFPKCCACYQQFESEDQLRAHGDEVHLPESQKSSSENENQFSCDVCYRRYKSKRILMDHKSKPYRTKQYQCSQCGRIFRDKCALSDHERCHQGERPFVCAVCSKTFAIKDSFRKHVKSHSIEEDRFKCEICQKGFKTKGNLKDHYITHAPDYRPLSCSLCSATFARKSCLNSHMRMHTGEKPFKCDQCDASYAFSTDLKRHRMAHQGIKPFVCTICGRGYPRKDYLRKHMANHLTQT
uniref:Zinc finger protein 865 n=1 Tax=Culex pipiens TaxID=7175 RepID=A0A8D8HIJ4_CULPI